MTRGKPTQAVQLIALARRHYEIALDQGGQPFGIPRRGPRIVRPLLGRGGSLRAALQTEFLKLNDSIPNPTALTGALEVLEAEAHEGERVEVGLRCARLGGNGLVIDLGTPDGRVIVVRDGAWKIREQAPRGVLFRRTAMTGAMPVPVRGGNLEDLHALVNVTDEGWELVRAWLVLAWQSHVPIPILALIGEHGSGKSSLGRRVVQLTDPNPVGLRGPPKDESQMQTTAAASRVLGFDNLSRILEWQSDALCRMVTGEGTATRRLYTDADLCLQAFRRAVLITSIDPGGFRGDLGDRLLPVELGRIRGREGENELDARAGALLPGILGALLDLVAEVLANPVKVDRPPRMADAAALMAATDSVTGGDALGAYARGRDDVAGQVLESDPVAARVLWFLDEYLPAQPHDPAVRNGWYGPATDLYRRLTPSLDERANWPRNARSLSQRLKNLEPSLRAVGVEVEWAKRGGVRGVGLRRRSRRRRIT